MSLDTTLLRGPFHSVFDVGAFRGDFARACLAAWPDCEVDCFEPLEKRPDDLADDERVWWHPVAVGAEPGSMEMWECEFVPSSSLLVMNELHKEAFPYTRENHLVTVRVVTLADYLLAIEPPALLKIDVQGYELHVLRGAEPVLERFETVALEVDHAGLYEGAATFEEIDGLLDTHDFHHVRRLDELRHPKTGQLLQTDELWSAV